MTTILNYTFAVYIADGKEHFAYSEKRLNDQSLNNSCVPFPDSLIQFLDLNLDELAPLFQRTSDALWELTSSEEKEHADEAISILEDLSARHIYFQFLLLDWKYRISRALLLGDYSEQLLQRSALLRMPDTLRRMQEQVAALFANVLDIDSGDQPALKRMAAYYAQNSDHFSFDILPLRFDLIDSDTFAEILEPSSVYELIDYDLRECVRRELWMRRCRNCGRWFALTGHQGVEYCRRVADNRGRTCREVGAIKVWAKNKKGNTLFEAYRKEYKKRHARIRTGKQDPDELYAWGAQARERMAEVEAGALTLDAFEAWLQES